MIWQIPVILLNFSILLLVVGLIAKLRMAAVVAGWNIYHYDVKVKCCPNPFCVSHS